MIVNIISETGISRAQGMHIAFLNHVETLKRAGITHAHTIGPLFWLHWLKTHGNILITAHSVPVKNYLSVSRNSDRAKNKTCLK